MKILFAGVFEQNNGLGSLVIYNTLMDTFFAATTPGLEQLTSAELTGLGFTPRVEPGGVGFQADHAGMFRANLYLRTASRVLARVGQFFYAETFSELREKAGRLPWERFLKPGSDVAFRVTCHKSKLIHTGAVAERIAGAIYDRLGQAPVLHHSIGSEDETLAAQLILVRVDHDRVTVSMDTSGDLLHRRGYRQALAKAPLRETLAAGMLLASGWDRKSTLIDPFCGSGTIAIEAALLAKGTPPGVNRRFAFMSWPGFDASAWQTLLAEVPAESGAMPVIMASDRDAGAVRMAQENAVRAGVQDCITFACQAVSALTPPAEPGWVVTNPPYGKRINDGKDLRNLYAQFGNVLRLKAPRWQLAVLSSDRSLLGQIGVRLDTSFTTINGGLGVTLGRGRVE